MSALELILDCHVELPGVDPEDWQLLSAEEQDKARRFVFDRDRQQSIRATAGLRRALARYCGLPAEKLVFERNDYGKPRLAMPGEGAPSIVGSGQQHAERWASCQFNLSHTSGAILIGIAEHALGVDVEHFGGRPFPESIMNVVFTAPECERIRADPLGIQIAGYLHWSRKEAVIKADGRGLSLNPASFELQFEPLATGGGEWSRDRWVCQIGEQSYFGATVALRTGWVCAVACSERLDRDAALIAMAQW